MASRCASEGPAYETPIGSAAFQYTDQLISLGPRPPGSAGIEKARSWISEIASKQNVSVQTDTFMSKTPIGDIRMKNLSYFVKGTTGSSRVILMAHYDSKRFLGFDFVGANDAASSVALLLALTPEIKKAALPFDVQVVFVDGEEALVRWSDTDGLYGSRHFASSQLSGQPVKAAIVVDMIGDADLQLIRNSMSDAKLMGELTQILTSRGLISLLEPKSSIVEDDHLPLVQAGVPTLHLMDFTFGGTQTPGTFWHTSQDTIDKISVRSLSVVGDLVLGILKKIG
jgi:glutaminyl-peptide cyclotransferase